MPPRRCRRVRCWPGGSFQDMWLDRGTVTERASVNGEKNTGPELAKEQVAVSLSLCHVVCPLMFKYHRSCMLPRCTTTMHAVHVQ